MIFSFFYSFFSLYKYSVYRLNFIIIIPIKYTKCILIFFIRLIWGNSPRFFLVYYLYTYTAHIRILPLCHSMGFVCSAFHRRRQICKHLISIQRTRLSEWGRGIIFIVFIENFWHQTIPDDSAWMAAPSPAASAAFRPPRLQDSLVAAN